MQRILGVLVVLGGWAIAMSGLFVTSATSVRLILACVGIMVSLSGSLGVLNGYYVQRAIWKQ